MNIVCVLGNGFDLNLGLKTSYKDFYGFYLKQEDEGKQSVRELKEAIGSEIDNWSDLELMLGTYTKNLCSTDEIDDIFFDISEKLAAYLEGEEKKFKFSSKDPKVFFADALGPSNHLTQREIERFERWKSSISSRVPAARQTRITVLTFNYTRTLELILGNADPIEEALGSMTSNTVFTGVEHVHGKLGETPVLGVNDIGQIANESLRESEEAMSVCVKPYHNETLGHMRDVRSAQCIRDANIICIFGSSLGNTDRIWWERIGERLKGDCSLFIFVRGRDIPLSRSVTAERDKRKVVHDFLDKTNLDETAKGLAIDKIYVGINTTAFNCQN